MFDKSAAYAAFEKVLAEARKRSAMRLLAYVIDMERNPLRANLVHRA